MKSPIIAIICLLIIEGVLLLFGFGVKESYVAPQTIRLSGKIYTCGTITTDKEENQDDKSLYCRGFKDGHDWAITESKEVPERMSKWQCKVVVTCPWSDWRFTDPEDVCTYKNEIIYATENPQQLESYGGSCNKI